MITIMQDLDGCLADFERGVYEWTGKFPDELSTGQLWASIGNPILKVNSPVHLILQALAYNEAIPKHADESQKAWRTLHRCGLVAQNEITDAGRAAYDVLKKFKPYMVERGFYEKLEFMPDGEILWDYVKQFDPMILTGLPRGDWAAPQKERWCKAKLGLEKDRVLTCMARDKAKKAQEFLGRELNGDILIDDREHAATPWIQAGGRFILHRDAESTITQLKGLGF